MFGAPRSEIVIDPRRATLLAMHLPPTASGNYPVMQGLTAHAERIFNTLIRPRSIPVKRDGEALDSNSRHYHASIGLAAADHRQIVLQPVAAVRLSELGLRLNLTAGEGK